MFSRLFRDLEGHTGPSRRTTRTAMETTCGCIDEVVGREAARLSLTGGLWGWMLMVGESRSCLGGRIGPARGVIADSHCRLAHSQGRGAAGSGTQGDRGASRPPRAGLCVDLRAVRRPRPQARPGGSRRTSGMTDSFIVWTHRKAAMLKHAEPPLELAGSYRGGGRSSCHGSPRTR
jgi:hypothetical protein